MGSWRRSGEEQSVWGINPRPGGLHFAPYPHHELNTQSSQHPAAFDFSSIPPSCLWVFFMPIRVFDVHLSSVVYRTPFNKGDLVPVHESSCCLCPTAAMPDCCFRMADGETCWQFRLFAFEFPGVSRPGDHPSTFLGQVAGGAGT